MTPLLGVTVAGVLLGIVLVIVAFVLLWWIIMFLFIRRGRKKRAARLAANPNAYPDVPPQQDWHGTES